MRQEESRIINIDKPEGITSFGVVKLVRRWTGYIKVGHAGTLDPMASGVLLICTGLETKRVSRLMELEKEYLGTITLGITTDTDDTEGEVKTTHPVPEFSSEEIERALDRFRGEIQQTPPMYSALKHKGRRLYKLAREGKVVPRKSRTVRIYGLELLSWKNPQIRLKVTCSRGTYIRSLARDIGEILGTGGILSQLRRSRIGPYTIQNAETLEGFKQECQKYHEGLSKH
jgi:tRNA pseudouridine55 synthase